MLIHTQKNNLSIPKELDWETELIDVKEVCFGKKDMISSIPEGKHHFVVRKDTQEYISMVGSNYKPTEYKDICEKQAQGLEKSGLLNKGNFTCRDYMFDGYGKFKRSVTFEDITIEPRVGDIVNFQQSGISSHDGSIPNTTDATPNRLACLNGMFTPVFKVIENFRHTRRFDIEILTDIYKKSTEKFFEMEPYFADMDKMRVSKFQIESALKETICKRKATEKKPRGYNEKLLELLMAQYLTEASKLGDTMWAFYNALTYWATHPENFEYKENAKLHNLERSNTDKVLVFMQSPQFKSFYN